MTENSAETGLLRLLRLGAMASLARQLRMVAQTNCWDI